MLAQGKLRAPSADVRLRTLVEVGRRWIASRKAPRDRVPEPGTAIIKMWEGKRYVVRVAEGGMFIYPGEPTRGERGNILQPKMFRSLSTIAKKIAGKSIYGPLFFDLPTQSAERHRVALELIDALAEAGFPIRRVLAASGEAGVVREVAALFRNLADDVEGKGDVGRKRR